MLSASLLSVGACTHMQSRAPAATDHRAPTPPASQTTAAPQTSQSPTTNAPPSTSPPAPASGGTSTAPKRQGARPAPPPTTKTKPVTPSTPGTTAAPAPGTPAAPGSNARAPERTDTTPTLDLAALEKRLRDTSAIGLFTKLSLKNQVDDLLQQFRGYHNKQSTTPLNELRQRYESLLNKVLGLLQSGDPDLAKAIAASREAIWGILIDPQKFAAI
jgi:hypothetical protein